MRESIQLVWFKKDLRVEDHLPLLRASKSGKVFCLYLFEPQTLSAPDFHVSHLRFAQESLFELTHHLRSLGGDLVCLNENATDALDRVLQHYDIDQLWSHEETGNWISFKRDEGVQAWCDKNKITWIQLPQTGVIRRLPSRDVWAKLFKERMEAPEIGLPAKMSSPKLLLKSQTPKLPKNLLAQSDRSHRQKGGRSMGMKYLTGFLEHRSIDYMKHISQPHASRYSCSRLSPYLSFGCLSVREVFRKTNHKIKTMNSSDNSSYLKRSLAAFQSRLHWHSHFIQKLESMPKIEFENMNRGFDGMRPEEPNLELLDKWENGQTGYPLVDAAMKCLEETGWINFRMRAMLISFTSFHLWQHWRHPSLVLAKRFLDYEPGIHYSQIQMQAGVTGMNQIRIYSPIKQAAEKDPGGLFIKKYLPALRHVPNALLHDPSQLSMIDQMEYGCKLGVDYPWPIVDHEFVYNEAKKKIYDWRNKKPLVKKQAKSLYKKIGSRKKLKKKKTKRKKS